MGAGKAGCAVPPGEHLQGEKETLGKEFLQRESSFCSSLYLHASLTPVHFSFLAPLVVSLPPREPQSPLAMVTMRPSETWRIQVSWPNLPGTGQRPCSCAGSVQ